MKPTRRIATTGVTGQSSRNRGRPEAEWNCFWRPWPRTIEQKAGHTVTLLLPEHFNINDTDEKSQYNNKRTFDFQMPLLAQKSPLWLRLSDITL